MKNRQGFAQKRKSATNLMLSHQLTPALTAIKWSLKMFLDGDFGETSQEQKQILEKLIQKNNSLISLLDALLHVAKLEEGEYDYYRTPCSIEDSINAAISNFQEDAAKKGIKVTVIKPEQKLPKLVLDKEMMQLAIGNIIDNAIKYTPQDGNITISLLLHKKSIEIQIQDFGIGIPLHQKDKLFHKFFRADNAKKVHDSGSGLGLFISKNIIEAHKGSIWFESEENKGTTFFIDLPLKER